jgi:hypothetical protein
MGEPTYASDLRSGDEIRLKEPPSVPSPYHGDLVEVAEVRQIGPSSYAVRIRDPAVWGGPTERDAEEFAQDDILCPYTVTSKHFEVPTDG